MLARKLKEAAGNSNSAGANAALEAEITPRGTREAILALDTTWLAEQEAAIALLRTQL